MTAGRIAEITYRIKVLARGTGSDKNSGQGKGEISRVKFEELSDFWQYFLQPWYDCISPEMETCFEGEDYYTDVYPTGYDMYESAELYSQKERWFNLPEFIEYTMSLQVHDHSLILRVYDHYEPLLLYYIQII